MVHPAQKRAIVAMLTEMLVAMQCENMRPVTFDIVEEVNSVGKSMPTADVKVLDAGVATENHFVLVRYFRRKHRQTNQFNHQKGDLCDEHTK